MEVSILCLLSTDNYNDAILKAVNFRQDTDTTDAVIVLQDCYIGINWLNQLAHKDDIEDLAGRMLGALQ
ncbi:hypothetical protein [Mucilaginibacter sp. SP1R1]|uniref:hypothetical protein n=1 Tax=Mucilaginibacter sp. SP1R1 TaxID=2723091 RepID=UPI001622A40F|nr:hypothetical protein [Mucilaginibacter sp. SP1R1]MBB6151772.1 ADP-ribosylglycohydrolase [Mucilaginibacter sp. SP1R1]